MRRYGDQPEPDRYYRRRPGVYAILPRNGSLLLTHQAEPQSEVQLPGGGIDPGESTLRALHREVIEETGWRITGARRLGWYKRFTYMPDYDLWAEKICHIYCATPVRPIGPPSEPGHTAMWLPSGAALEVMAGEGDTDMLRRFLAGEFGSFSL